MVAHTRPQVHVLAHLAYKLVYQQHELTHMGKTALVMDLNTRVFNMTLSEDNMAYF